MTDATDLLEDIFTFVCFLHAEDVRPRGRRFLPPGALNALNAQLRAPDPAPIRSERAAPRIAFIHFLCEAAGFIARVGDTLKPTPQAQAWLASAPADRLRPFARALRSGDPMIDALWRAYHLPGWRGDPPRAALQAFILALRETPRLTWADLAHALPATLHDAPDAQPRAIAQALARCLTWLGWVEARRGRVTLTTLGRHALLDTAPPDDALPAAPAEPHAQPAVTIAHDGDFVAAPHASWTALYELCAYADVTAVQPRRRYRLSEARVRRALARGAAPHQIIAALERVAGDALPPTIAEAIHAWAAAFGRLRIHRVALIEARDGQLWAELLRRRGIRDCVRPLSARAAAIKPGKVSALIRRLERRGVPPHVALAPPTDPARPRPSTASTQLYLAVRLCHRLAGLIPAHLLPPYALALDLERQIEPAAAEAVAALVDAAFAPDVDDPRRPAAPDDVLNALAEALAARDALDIHYHGRDDAAPRWRRIEPRRMTWRAGIAYVIAWCHHAQAERTFRADRILAINRSNTTPASASPADGRSSRSS